MQADLITWIKQNSPITDVVGDNVSWGMMPTQNSYPQIVLQEVSEDIGIAHDGLTCLDTARVQINCWSYRFDQSLSLRRLVKNHLVGETNTVIGSTTFAAVSIPPFANRYVYLPTQKSEDHGPHNHIIDLMISYYA